MSAEVFDFFENLDVDELVCDPHQGGAPPGADTLPVTLEVLDQFLDRIPWESVTTIRVLMDP